MVSEREIIATIQDRGGKPPFTVWSSGFLDMRDGKPIPNSGMPPHRGTSQDIEGAAQKYLGVASGKVGKDVQITQVPRIVDSENTQVYP